MTDERRHLKNIGIHTAIAEVKKMSMDERI